MLCSRGICLGFEPVISMIGGVRRSGLRSAAETVTPPRHPWAMITTRPIPDWLYEAASGRATRIVDYRAAAWLYALDGVPTLEPEFSIAHGTRKRRPFDHQRRRIDDLEIVEIQGLLLTSVPQTLVDLCAVVHPDIVERAAESALRMQLVHESELREFASTAAFYRRGAPDLRDVLARRPLGAPPTGSDLETMCPQVFRRGGIREPVRQHPVIDSDGEVVAISDFGFPPKVFVVETDGLETHAKTREQQQYDLNRQNRISDAGHTFRRFTYTDVTQRPRYVCRETERGLLAAQIVLPTPPILRRAS